MSREAFEKWLDSLQMPHTGMGISRMNEYRTHMAKVAFEAGWQAAMESQWISVDDRLPDTDQTALTYDKDCKEIRTTWFADWRDIKNFQWLSHWMPLPQPPKEKL